MEVQIEAHETTTIFHMEGRLDLAGAEVVEQNLQQLETQRIQHSTVIISFHDVHYISSSGLRVIVAAFNHVDEHGGKMILCGMDIGVMEVFEFAGLTDVFDIVESLPEAKKQVGLPVL
ncbi:MAG: STAS domain-containing protein [Sumerlaeia bacterium]